MRIRCKMKLNSVTERIGSKSKYDDNKNHIGYENCLLYDAEFNVVVGGTGDDNQKFWDYTPSGSIKLATINRMPWVIGNEYYIDIIPMVDG